MRLEDRRPGRIRPDLVALERALAGLGNPQRSFSSILVVGTNGKGSTAVMLDAVLREHGVVAGLYTSPHLRHVGERIRVDSAPGLVDRCFEAIEAWPDLTYFEAVTAAAFLAFAEAGVEVAVLEAGMGGSWDATRLADPGIVGLTNVGTDHRAWLGATRAEIAADKGRALAAAAVAVLGPGVDDGILPFLAAPDAVRAESILPMGIGGDRITVRVDGREIGLHAPLPGRHQLDNLMLAVALASCRLGGRLAVAPLVRGLDGVRWPGRLSTHVIDGREIVLEGAHNLEAARALAEYLRHGEQEYNMVFSCLDDKPVEEMAELLAPVVGEIAVCALDDERAMPVDRLARAFPRALRTTGPRQALAALGDPVLAAGSLRLVGALLEYDLEEAR